MNSNLITDEVELVTNGTINEMCNEFSTNCLALTIRKDYRFTIFSNIVDTVRRVSFKVLFNVGILNFLSVIF